MLIAPNWNLKKSQIQNFIDAEIEKRGVIQGSEFR
jgi:radical SAM superfamily enzyme